MWERINIELGAESTFSGIQFDDGVLAVGDKGITICNGNTVDRIDTQIRDEVFKIHNGNDGPKRVHGVRDFFEQVVYWTFPAADVDPTFSNRMLLYNYDNKSWAFLNDSLTTLGQYYQTSDVTWADLGGYTWETYQKTWNAGVQQSGYAQIVGGNQQGFILQLNSKTQSDESRFITSISAATPPTITSPDHNFQDGDVVEITGIKGSASVLNGYRYQVNNAQTDTFQLYSKPKFAVSAIDTSTNQVTATGNTLQVGDLVQFSEIVGTTELNGVTGAVIEEGNQFTVDIDMAGFTAYSSGGYAEDLVELFQPTEMAGSETYIGCGVIAAVDNFSIRSKKFNMVNQGRQTHVGYLDFLCPTTSNGEVSVPVYVDYNDTERVNPRGIDSFFNHSIPTTLTQFATQNQSKDWHRFFCNVDSQFFQYGFTLDEAQLVSTQIQGSAFEVDGVVIWHETGSKLT